MLLIAVLCAMPFIIHAQSTGTLPSSLWTTTSTVQQVIVDTHNGYRRSVNPSARNMLKMMWSEAAASNAATWSATCPAAHSPTSQRTISGVTCGENIFIASYPASWQEAITAWNSESQYFQYGVGPTSSNQVTGHYTQLVWYNSYMVGCAVSNCNNQYIYVCQYCPMGNNLNTITTPYKSGPACGDCPGACDNGLCTNPCPYEDQYSNCDDLASGDQCDTYQIVKEGCPGSCLCKNNEII
uniref:Cysteine-rich secretory protein 1 gene 7 n=1 Tax=Xenopus tropicalis TaxID=8364 RepID=A0A6I8QJE2_XENTR